MISLKHIVHNLYELTYLDNKIYFCINMCSKITDTIENEVKYIGISIDKPQAIIPEKLVKTPLQFIQAIIHYTLYSNELSVRNKGLLLSMLVIGEDQINDAVELLSNSYRESNKYYVFSINNNCKDKVLYNCEPFIMNNFQQKWMYYESLVKNLANLLKRL